MRPKSSLPETLQRLDALIEDQRLNRAELLDPSRLAEDTALPESTVRTLLSGGTPPREEVGERVCARVRKLADAHLARTGRRKPELVAAVHRQCGISEVWARLIIGGRKVPSVELLHALVKFFDLDDAREAFFTDEAPDALNRALLPILDTYEHPEQDPVQALMKKYGVVATDMRHHGSLTAEQLETLLAGVIKSVMPPQEDNGR
ncbi:hypothetical protein ACH4ND_22555 [Streptomyces sp. NPDC017179]|uniref:hypothetical protein n=1 Tax=Streptomyces sp. NPDC017179 TaxID=3364979 RepID=UPI0037AA5DCB